MSSEDPEAVRDRQLLSLLEFVDQHADSDGICSKNSIDAAASLFNGDHNKCVGIIKALETRKMIVASAVPTMSYTLTTEGDGYSKTGSPEFRAWAAVSKAGKDGMTSQDLNAHLGPIASVGLNRAMKEKWLSVCATSNKVIPQKEGVEDTTTMLLRLVEQHGLDEKKLKAELAMLIISVDKTLDELKKRKLIEIKKINVWHLEKGPIFKLEIKKVINDITADILVNDAWKDMELKVYNFFSCGLPPSRGSVHPLIRVRNKFVRILKNLDFEEMPTNKWVESSFWCFDTLFMPQQHPARDIQDTFFIDNPECSDMQQGDRPYIERVRKVHQDGDYGSLGWQYQWSEYESSRNVLRTHTTATSAWMLYQLGQNYQKTGVFTPKRYFSIDRVFRNETLDATHLAEFHQIEGLVADRNISLPHLMGIMRTFYTYIGITELKFKPAYNPYTEPSMEIFGFHEELNKWIEVGNSGLFRPEMLLPMGLPPDVGVMAWGLSLERPTMIRHGISNIRELFGHKANIGIA